MGHKRRYSPKMLLPESVFAILGALSILDKVSKAFEIEDVSGFSHTYLTFCNAKLQELGWIRKPYRNAYMITERGKIVLALETGRRTRGRGRFWMVQAFTDFTDYGPLKYHVRQERLRQIAAAQSASPSPAT